MDNLIKSIIEQDDLAIAFELSTIIDNADKLRNIGLSLFLIALEKELKKIEV